MTNNSRGLFANSWGTVSTVGGIGPQGASTSPSDNFWQGTLSNGMYQTYTDQNSSAANSKLFTRNGPTGYPLVLNLNFGANIPISYSNSAFSYTNSSGSLFPCNTTPCPGCLSREWRDIPADSLDFSDPTLDVSRFMLFQSLDSDSLLLADGGDTLQSFYEANLPVEYGQMSDIEAALASGQFTLAGTLLSAFSPATTLQENYAYFFTAYLQAATNNTLSYSDSLSLLTLAYQCPATDGPAVYKARTLYNDIYKTILEFNDDNCVPDGYALRTCNPEEPQLAIGALKANERLLKKEGASYKIYPNPNWGDLYIVASLINEKVQLVISDISNRILTDEIIQFNQNGKFQKQFDFINGVYFVTLTSERGKVTRKIIVNK